MFAGLCYNIILNLKKAWYHDTYIYALVDYDVFHAANLEICAGNQMLYTDQNVKIKNYFTSMLLTREMLIMETKHLTAK